MRVSYFFGVFGPRLCNTRVINCIARVRRTDSCLRMKTHSSALSLLRRIRSGTLQERAERLFSLKNLDRKEFPTKVRAKNFIG